MKIYATVKLMYTCQCKHRLLYINGALVVLNNPRGKAVLIQGYITKVFISTLMDKYLKYRTHMERWWTQFYIETQV